MIGATIFTVAAALAICLHIALMLGAPIGFMTLGGRNPGVLPTGARVASFVQIVLLIALTAIVLGAADIISSGPAALIWGVVAISAVSLILNTITPSKRERCFGVPVGLGLLTGSTLVALGD